MALVTHKFKLDLTPGAARQVLYTSQGDIGRPFEADLYWNGSPWTATGTTANIRGKKPDDTVFDYTATVSGTAVTFETTEQMTIISGPVECELVFSNDGDIIASANFVLMVEDSPYNPDALSQSVVSGVEDVVNSFLDGADDDISRLNDLSFSFDNYYFPVTWFEKGNIEAGQNDNWRINSRARTKKVLEFDCDVFIKKTAGWLFLVYYNQNNVFTGWSGWTQAANGVKVAAGQKFRIVATKNKDATEAEYYELDSIVKDILVFPDNTAKHIVGMFYLDFEHGSLNHGQNDTFHEMARARTKTIVSFPFDINIYMESGQYTIDYFDKADNYISGSGWKSTEKTFIKANDRFRLLLTSEPANEVFEELGNIINPLNIRAVFPKVNEYSAIPNMIFQCRNVDDTKYPPYTKWYIQAAAENQYDRVRFNVRKTTDGYYILCHDNTINNEARNPDGSVISESVPVYGKTLAELNQYDWGIKYGAKYAGVGVPMLEDALKWSALFNMPVALEYADDGVLTDTSISETLALCDKYGVTDRLYAVDYVGNLTNKLEKFIAHNPRISVCVAGVESWYTQENIEKAKALQTPFNTVYVQMYPWGQLPTNSFVTMAKNNGFSLHSSIFMTKAQLLQLSTFNHGFTSIEANNVYNIKDTIREWVADLVDGYETVAAAVSQGILLFSQGDAEFRTIVD